jgi:hypothetical protein
MTEAKTKVPGIYAKIAEVRKKLPVLAKNGVGPSAQGGYKFLSIDDILSAVVPLENELGIISFPVENHTEFHYNTGEIVPGGRAPKENTTAMSWFVFRYVDVSDGSYIDVPVTGEGTDSQDKATRKATTQAQKIANITVYNLITGEPDPDSQNGADSNTASTPAPPAVTKAQAPRRPTRPTAAAKDDFPARTKLLKLIEEKGLNQEEVGARVAAYATKAKRTNKVDDDYQAVLDELAVQSE